MQQRLRMPDSKPEDMNLIPETHVIERKLTGVVILFCDLHTGTMVCMPTYIHVYEHTK